MQDQTLQEAFRAFETATRRRNDGNFAPQKLGDFFESLDAASAEDVDTWFAQLRHQSAYLELLCNVYIAWFDRLLNSEFYDSTTFGEVLDTRIDHAEIEHIEYMIEDAYEDAETMGLDGEEVVEAVTRAPEHGSPTVEIRTWSRAFQGTMLWDTASIKLSDPIASTLVISAFCDRATLTMTPSKSQRKSRALDRYHPERFMTWNPGVKAHVKAVHKRYGQLAKGMRMEDLERLTEVVAEGFNKRIRELPHATMRTLPQLCGAPMNQAISLAGNLLLWVACGRQIFDLPPSLVDRFRQTDVDDVPLSMLKPPYPVFYLYWGAQADMMLAPGWFADGAYVMSMHGHMQIIVTSTPVDAAELAWTPIKGEPYAAQAFSEREMGMDVGTAVDEVLATELKELKARASQEGFDYDSLLREWVDRGDVDPCQVPLHATDVSARSAHQEIERLHARHEGYKQALKLVINAMCYLTAYPNDNAPQYSEKAPAQYLKMTRSEDTRTAKYGHSRLEELGYLPVHVCGQELIEHTGEATDGHSHRVRTHWRRGHWRRQPYGENRALRKLVWIMPAVVGRTEKEPEDPLGHVYLVS